MAEINLGRGYIALVDDEDVERLSAFRWISWRTGDERYRYAVTGHGKKRMFMHRIVTNAPKGLMVDHANGNRLDNRKSNLRVCTHAENMRNRVGTRNGFKGVTLRKNGNYTKPWGAAVERNGKSYFLGSFATEVEAARAYDAGAIRLHGEFAFLNFPLVAE